MTRRIDIVRSRVRLYYVEKQILVITVIAVVGLPPIVGGEFKPCTSIENGGSAVDAVPSFARILRKSYRPTSPEPGTPDSSPVAVSNVAQVG